MKRSENTIKITLAVAALVVGVALSTAARSPITPQSDGGNSPLMTPAPSTFDQVTHDVGNIAPCTETGPPSKKSSSIGL